ncbi:hypothetical protein [Nocardiopsis kunsanensis]|uniref:hypothetical protein n=1 Tax=Nocardiopsis kunsanensis TaxID=141693 RepID=UPI0018772EEE|nr:hypothetical protein [Nocardiopsis kunsanensis]
MDTRSGGALDISECEALEARVSCLSAVPELDGFCSLQKSELSPIPARPFG